MKAWKIGLIGLVAAVLGGCGGHVAYVPAGAGSGGSGGGGVEECRAVFFDSLTHMYFTTDSFVSFNGFLSFGDVAELQSRSHHDELATVDLTDLPPGVSATVAGPYTIISGELVEVSITLEIDSEAIDTGEYQATAVVSRQGCEDATFPVAIEFVEGNQS